MNLIDFNIQEGKENVDVSLKIKMQIDRCWCNYFLVWDFL